MGEDVESFGARFGEDEFAEIGEKESVTVIGNEAGAFGDVGVLPKDLAIGEVHEAEIVGTADGIVEGKQMIFANGNTGVEKKAEFAVTPALGEDFIFQVKEARSGVASVGDEDAFCGDDGGGAVAVVAGGGGMGGDDLAGSRIAEFEGLAFEEDKGVLACVGGDEGGCVARFAISGLPEDLASGGIEAGGGLTVATDIEVKAVVDDGGAGRVTIDRAFAA